MKGPLHKVLINWKFYHFGPWAREAEESMQEISSKFDVRWDTELNPSYIFNVPRMPKLGIDIEGLMTRILKYHNTDN